MNEAYPQALVETSLVTHGLTCDLELDHITPDGRLIEGVRQPMHSYVKVFTQLLIAHAFNYTGSFWPEDVTGPVLPFNGSNSLNFGANTVATNDAYGVVIGGAVGANTSSIISLQVKYASAIFYHDTVIFDVPIANSQNVYFRVKRRFQNVSGISRDIGEIGLYVLGVDSGGTKNYCIIRENVGTPFTVTNNSWCEARIKLNMFVQAPT